MPCRRLLPYCLISISAALQVPFLSSKHPANNIPYSSNLTRVNSVVYTDIILGDQKFKVLLDTGSSDTWVTSSDFACIIKNIERPQVACEIGPLYDVDDDFDQIHNQVLHAQYEPMVATGFPGITSVTLGNLSITAEVGVV